MFIVKEFSRLNAYKCNSIYWWFEIVICMSVGIWIRNGNSRIHHTAGQHWAKTYEKPEKIQFLIVDHPDVK